MSTRTNDAERVTATVTVLAAALAAGAVYLLSDWFVIERTVLVATTAAAAVAVVGVAAILYVHGRS